MVPQGLEDTVAQALDVSKVRSKTDIAKVQDIQDLWSRFTARLQFRLNLAKMYFDFHRHRQLVSCTWKKKVLNKLLLHNDAADGNIFIKLTL